MTNKSTRLLAAFAATIALALVVGLASANQLSYSEQYFRITWTRLSFSEVGGGFPITCPVTLEGSFHSRTMSKVNGALVAVISSAEVDNSRCTEGHGTVLQETLPWHVRYESFTGTLPTISRVRHSLVGAGFQIEPAVGIVCLAQTTERFPAAGEATRDAEGNIVSLITDSTLSIPVVGELCPRLGIFSGSGQVFVRGSTTTRVSLTLI